MSRVTTKISRGIEKRSEAAKRWRGKKKRRKVEKKEKKKARQGKEEEN